MVTSLDPFFQVPVTVPLACFVSLAREYPCALRLLSSKDVDFLAVAGDAVLACALLNPDNPAKHRAKDKIAISDLLSDGTLIICCAFLGGA